jgi:hypothetical protein
MAFNTTGEELKEQVEEIIKCPICLENFCDPRILPCSHTFCLECIKNLAFSNDGQFQCPLRDGDILSTKIIASLPSNLVVREMADLVSKNAGKQRLTKIELRPSIQ